MYFRFCIASFALLFAVNVVSAQESTIEARIAGLESNEEYMSLLREDAQLQMREDSVTNAVARIRTQLRDDPAGRQRYSQKILALESRIFDIRNAKGRLIDRINTIEQEWVLANLDSSSRRHETDKAADIVPDSLKVRNLVDNLYFREHLAPEDYGALRRAQRMETEAVDYVSRYIANYGTIGDLAEAYASAENETDAMDIYDRYHALQGINRVISDSLSLTWNYIFDNKSYAYAYVLDKFGSDESLARQEAWLSDAMRRFSAVEGKTASDAVADYLLRKRVIVDYEREVARELNLSAALDSLNGVAAQLEGIDYRLPKIDVTERYFLDYDSVAFSSTPKYTYQHPIPECKVYANGTIYRILLGTFNTKRAAATFRGAYPLFYLIDEDGKWNYFTGGFATREEADKAQALLKKKGFVRPEVVVWTDGTYRNLSREPEAAAVSYRVEISGTETLSDEIKEAIVQTAEGCELSRVGQQLFVVGTFGDRAVADRVAQAVRQKDAALEIKVAPIDR